MSTERENRIDRLKQQIRDVVGDESFIGSIPDCPPEIEVPFLERVLWFEKATGQPLRDRLAEAGIILTDPDQLADKDLTRQIWDVIQALVTLHIIPGNTDHLSDRQLYTCLWNIVTSGETVPPDFFSRGWYIDLTGHGENGLDVYVKYYANDDERDACHRKFPQHPLPEHCEPPYNRDNLIPDL